MQTGLCESTSVGRWGSFGDAGKVRCGLNTCAVYGWHVFTLGPDSQPIGAPSTGPDLRVTTVRTGWTGKTMLLTCGDAAQRVDLRTSLPGPMFTPAGRKWAFDWTIKGSPLEVVSLPDGRSIKAWGVIDRPPQLMLAKGRSSPVLVITSSPAERLAITTHENWRFDFDRAKVRIMFVPLLEECDSPRTVRDARLWLELIDSPPITCREYFNIDRNMLAIRSDFADSEGNPTKLAPLSPSAALCGSARGLQCLPEHIPLLTTPLGPYGVTRGPSCTRTIQLDWARAVVRPTRSVTGELSQVPKELTYPGDVSWDESTPMDALLCCRQWAPLAEICPSDMWQEVRARFEVPSAEDFRASLASFVEPANGRSWQKDASLFEHCGQISYDTDWYNGLTLSGLQRAAVCADETLSGPARRLSSQVRSQRANMLAYMEIYCDWALGAAWTDPRGGVWDLDCSHNGLEGVLAEARLREMEGDKSGSDYAMYLAGRMAVSFIAAMDMGQLCYRLGTYVRRSENEPGAEEDIYYIRTFRETTGAVCVTPLSRCPVIPAPEFPEYCALVREYGPLPRMRDLSERYIEENPGRYEDWLGFYLGSELAEAVRANDQTLGFGQERRTQAAVFYHVAHDTSLRLWVLGQSGDEVEGLHKIPMPLSSQLYCRANAKLEVSGI